jgi:MFS family permease
MTPNPHLRHNRKYKIKLVIAGFIALSLSTGILINSIGQFINPIHDDMGYQVGAISLAFSIVWGTVILSATTVAKFIDRYSPRICMTVSATVISVMALIISFTNEMWQLYLCTIAMGLVFTGLHTLPVSVMINNSFSGKKSMATSIAFAGTGFGGLVFNPLFNFIISNYGWRIGFMVMAGIYFVGGIVIVSLIKIPKEHINKTEYLEIEISETSPSELGKLDDSSDVGMNYKDAIRSKKFILMVIGLLIFCGTGSGTMMHSVPYMISIGISSQTASLLFSMFMFLLAVSKIILGFILHKLGTQKGTILGIGFYIATVASLLLLHISPFFYIIFLIFGGIGLSTATVTTPIITSYLFGNKDYTRILGAAIIFNGIGNLTFPFMLGRLFDITGNYIVGWVILTCLLTVGLICYLANFRMQNAEDTKAIQGS